MWSSMLCFLRKDEQILLGMKKRDFGKGKWNGIGGKVEGDKSVKAAAVREIREEIGVLCEEDDLQQVATLEFRSANKELEWNVEVFFITKWSGEPSESDEIIPQWFNESELPFDLMWPDDRIWFPYLLAGKTIRGKFVLDEKGKEILEHEVTDAVFLVKTMEHREIEVKFLEVNKEALVKKLHELGAEDQGEDLLEEVIIYDKALTWNGNKKLLRLRTRKDRTYLTYKHHVEVSTDGAEEIEVEVSDGPTTEALLERLGYVAYRHQQKRRHTFHLGEVTVDIDTWPRVPTYIELEGPSEQALKDAALELGFDWAYVNTQDARTVIEEVYNIPLRTVTWFTFDRFE